MSSKAPAQAQQPAAICSLKTSADAIHVLEAVRVGIVPRVTRRLTGIERTQIRAGSVWIWEEDETSMKRWTDGRRWGPSRVGGGGYLLYSESNKAGPSAQPATTTPNGSAIATTSAAPATVEVDANGMPGRGTLIKQTFSTNMRHPVTGKTTRFHLVAYSAKNATGDITFDLPCPAQLPLLANLQVAPGVWVEWEKQRDGVIAVRAMPKKLEGTTRKKPKLEILPSPISLEVSKTSIPVPTQSIRGPGSAPPSFAPDPRSVSTPPYDPAYYYAPPQIRSAPPSHTHPHHAGALPSVLADDRYHPYRDRPYHGQPLTGQPPSLPYVDARREIPPLPGPPQEPMTYYAQPNAQSPYLPAAYRDMAANRLPYQSHMMAYSSSYPEHSSYHYPINPYQLQSHQPRHPPAREMMYSPAQPVSATRSPKMSISSALSGEAGDPARLTLPPLRVAIDGPTTRQSPKKDVRPGLKSELPPPLAGAQRGQ